MTGKRRPCVVSLAKPLSWFTKGETEAQRACLRPPRELAAELGVEPRTPPPSVTFVSSPEGARPRKQWLVCARRCCPQWHQEPGMFGRRGHSRNQARPASAHRLRRCRRGSGAICWPTRGVAGVSSWADQGGLSSEGRWYPGPLQRAAGERTPGAAGEREG